MKKRFWVIFSLILSVLFISCGDKKEEKKAEAKGAGNLTIYCPHPLEFINP